MWDDYLISDIEAQIGDLQSRKKDLIEEVKGEERVGLGESGFYERDIYITVAVVNTMNISHPLPSVTKWRYVIISRYFLYNLIQDPYIGKLHLVYTCNTHADHSGSYSCCLWVSVISSILFLFAALVILAVAEENPELVNCVHVILMSLPKVTEQHLCLSCLLFPLVFRQVSEKPLTFNPQE